MTLRIQEVAIMVKNRRVLSLLIASTVIGGALVASIPAVGLDLGSLLKGGAAVVLTSSFSGQINDFINKVTLNSGVGVKDRTKVVPILSVGQGGYAGAAQISGPAHLVDKVQAVAQLESRFQGIRVKALVPIATKDLVKDLKRVGGVGVSAIVDLKL